MYNEGEEDVLVTLHLILISRGLFPCLLRDSFEIHFARCRCCGFLNLSVFVMWWLMNGKAFDYVLQPHLTESRLSSLKT